MKRDRPARVEPAAAGATDARRPPVVAALVVLSLAIAGLRLFTYHEPIERDVAVYAVIADEMLHGQRLYADLWDHKPPATHVTYALAELVCGYGYGSLYFMGVAAGILAMLGVYKAASAVGGAWAGLWGAACWAFACGDPFLQLNQPNTEVFINAAMIWVLALFLGARRGTLGWRGAVLVGVAAALASLYKQVVVAPAAMLCLVHLAVGPRGQWKARLRDVAVIAAVGGLAWGGVFAYFKAAGTFADFNSAVFVFNRAYAGDVWQNLLDSLAPTSANGPAFFQWTTQRTALPLLLVSLVGAGIALGRRRGSLRAWLVLAAFAVGTHVAVSLPGRAYPHYNALWYPLLAVCAGLGIRAVGLIPVARPAVLEYAVGGAVTLAVLAVHLSAYRFSPQMLSVLKYQDQTFIQCQVVGRQIKDMLKPTETLYELGAEPGLYFDSQRRPASGIVYCYPYQSPKYPDCKRIFQRLKEDLRQHPPDMMVLTHPDVSGGELNLERYARIPVNPERGRFLLLARKGSDLEARLRAAAAGAKR